MTRLLLLCLLAACVPSQAPPSAPGTLLVIGPSGDTLFHVSGFDCQLSTGIVKSGSIRVRPDGRWTNIGYASGVAICLAE